MFGNVVAKSRYPPLVRNEGNETIFYRSHDILHSLIKHNVDPSAVIRVTTAGIGLEYNQKPKENSMLYININPKKTIQPTDVPSERFLEHLQTKQEGARRHRPDLLLHPIRHLWPDVHREPPRE